MRINVQQIKPTLAEAIKAFFPPAEGVGHPNYQLPTAQLPFSVRLSDCDLVCDFGNLGWDALQPDDLQQFENLEYYLRSQGLIAGEVVLECTKFRVRAE